MSQMEETTRKAFVLNVYNIMITYAFIKVGVGTLSSLSRMAFFTQVAMQIGPNDYWTLDDLEHGILRGGANGTSKEGLSNSSHHRRTHGVGGGNNSRRRMQPTTPAPPLASEQAPPISLSCSWVDCRIHFALNCGAKSCPPIRFFHAEKLDEELQLVSESFCESDHVIRVMMVEKDDKSCESHLYLSMIFKWYQQDFVKHKKDLPRKLLEFLRQGSRQRVALEQMVERYEKDPVRNPILIKYINYDWTVHASRYQTYKGRGGMLASAGAVLSMFAK